MSEQQQPKEHCDHERVCKEYREWYEFVSEIDAICKYSTYCHHFKVPHSESQQRIEQEISMSEQRCRKWKCCMKPCDEKCTKDCPIYKDNCCTDCIHVDDCLNAEFERSKV